MDAEGHLPEDKLHKREASLFILEGVMRCSKDDAGHQLHDTSVLLGLQMPFQLASVLLDIAILAH